MDSDQKNLVESTPNWDVLQKDPDEMTLTEAAQASAMLQTMEKVIKARRTNLSGRLKELYESGEHKFESTTDKTDELKSDGFKLKFTKKGGGSTVNPYKLKKLIEENPSIPDPGSIINMVIEVKRSKLDEKAVRRVLAQNGIDESEVYKPVEIGVNETALATVMSMGVFDKEDIDSITDDVPRSYTITCTLEDDLKKSLTKKLEGED